MVALKASIQVLISVRVKQKIRPSKTSGKRRIIILQCVRVEQLSSIVGVVSGVLEPYREPRLVKALADEFRIPSCNAFSSTSS